MEANNGIRLSDKLISVKVEKLDNESESSALINIPNILLIKHEELLIKDEELSLKNEELLIRNEELLVKIQAEQQKPKQESKEIYPPFLYCYFCKYKSNFKCSIKYHIFKYHLNNCNITELKYDCNYCPVETKTLAGLTIHEKYKHSLVKCSFCQHMSKNKLYLNRHIITKHNNKYLKCGKCHFSTKCKWHIRKHEKKHLKTKKLSLMDCPQCNYKTTNKERLNYHLKLKHYINIEKNKSLLENNVKLNDCLRKLIAKPKLKFVKTEDKQKKMTQQLL